VRLRGQSERLQPSTPASWELTVSFMEFSGQERKSSAISRIGSVSYVDSAQSEEVTPWARAHARGPEPV
jgi:hypothetical protein